MTTPPDFDKWVYNLARSGYSCDNVKEAMQQAYHQGYYLGKQEKEGEDNEK